MQQRTHPVRVAAGQGAGGHRDADAGLLRQIDQQLHDRAAFGAGDFILSVMVGGDLVQGVHRQQQSSSGSAWNASRRASAVSVPGR